MESLVVPLALWGSFLAAAVLLRYLNTGAPPRLARAPRRTHRPPRPEHDIASPNAVTATISGHRE
ncbi:hypothetical protein OG225_26150 [Nocardia sp. NBC_01377]|uniref:hypothetical protein n=1 Tax=Nocardia sp. NBC_01377 TaxID=2903595 RepID=UPI003247C74C